MLTVELQPVSKPVPRLAVVMGVAGSGKSTIARHLSSELAAVYLDGDDYHPQSSVSKMSQGIALTDEDRWPWLDSFAQAMSAQDGNAIGACSSLRKVYRERITAAAREPVLFIYLDGSKALISQRLSARENHFMPACLLDSQFKTLEPPGQDELAIGVDISGSKQQIIRLILKQLRSMKHGN